MMMSMRPSQKLGMAVPREDRDGDDQVQQAVAFERGQDAERHGDGQADGGGCGRQHPGVAQAFKDKLHRGPFCEI